MKQSMFYAAAVMQLAAVASASVTNINFGAEFRDPDNGSIILTDQLASFGVNFSAPDTDGVYWLGSDYPWEGGQFAIFGGNPLVPGFNAFDVRIDFVSITDSVSIRAYDGGGDIDTVMLSAYDAGNNLIATDDMTSSFGVPGHTLTVLSENISYVVISTTGVEKGVFLDDLSFGTVPTPSSLVILCSGCIITRRRRA